MSELPDREVYQNPELEEVREELSQILMELKEVIATTVEISDHISKFEKQNKEIFEHEILKRLDDGEKKIDSMDIKIKDNGEKLGKNEKKLRFFKD